MSLVSLVAIDVWICNECIMIENSIINPKKYITYVSLYLCVLCTIFYVIISTINSIFEIFALFVRSRRNELSTDMLNQLLSFALKRMCYVKGVSESVFLLLQ